MQLLIYSEGRLVGYVTSPETETIELGFSAKIRGLWHTADTQEGVAFETNLRRGGRVEVTVDGDPLVTGARTLISAAADGEVWLVSTGRPDSR